MHKRETVIEKKKLRIAIQMTAAHVLAQRFEHGTIWAARVLKYDECVCVMLQNQETSTEECFSSEFFLL